MSRQPSRNGGQIVLPALRYDPDADAFVATTAPSPREPPRDPAVAHLETRLAEQERTTRALLDHALRVKDDVIASLGTSRGSWQTEPQSRELLQEHIRAITDVVRKLGRDIQYLESQIKERDGATVGTQHVVKNLEMHHVAGVTDLRSRVARCDASIARLAVDLKSAFDSIQTLSQRQQEQHTQIIERLHQLDSKVQSVTAGLDRIQVEHSMQLQHVESGAVNQLTGLDAKTRSLADDLKASINAARIAEINEREKLEARLMGNIERSLGHWQQQQEKNDGRREDSLGELHRNVIRLQEELQRERERVTQLQRGIETAKPSNTVSESVAQRQADELARLKRELRDGFQTVTQSLDEVRELVEARRQLMEEQLRKEMAQIRKMIVLVN